MNNSVKLTGDTGRPKTTKLIDFYKKVSIYSFKNVTMIGKSAICIPHKPTTNRSGE
jgi:hypothetical protein